MNCKLTQYAFLIGSFVLLLFDCAHASMDDVITDTKVKVAHSALEYSLKKYQDETATVSMYTNAQMDNLISENKHLIVIEQKDKCQFTPDIEARARVVGVAAFEFAWADMLITGTCVQKDEKLGLDFFNRSLEHGYAKAYERMALYYEKGQYVREDLVKSENYMRVAASLGSSSGRLQWVDMLVRGFGSSSMYEQAYSWLYHTSFNDSYLKAKSDYLIRELSKKMPPNIIARAIAVHTDSLY